MTTVDEIINRAKAELGTKEDPPGSNKVKYNQWFYNRADAYGPEYPWCCVYVSYIFRGTNLLKKTASCQDLYIWCKNNGLLVNNPERGDIVFYKFGNTKRITNHVGIVNSYDGICTNAFEGNTSTTSQHNGGCVMLRNRYSNIVGYARPKYTKGTLTNVTRKSNEEIAREVLAGKWSNNPERRQRLTAAGYDYEAIRKIVNDMKKK